MPFETFFLATLKVKVTLEGQMIKWVIRPELVRLCMDFKIIWHSCLSETFVR